MSTTQLIQIGIITLVVTNFLTVILTRSLLENSLIRLKLLLPGVFFLGITTLAIGIITCDFQGEILQILNTAFMAGEVQVKPILIIWNIIKVFLMFAGLGSVFLAMVESFGPAMFGNKEFVKNKLDEFNRENVAPAKT